MKDKDTDKALTDLGSSLGQFFQLSFSLFVVVVSSFKSQAVLVDAGVALPASLMGQKYRMLPSCNKGRDVGRR